MEVRPLKFSPLGAENPVPSGQVACVPNPLKVIVSSYSLFGRYPSIDFTNEKLI